MWVPAHVGVEADDVVDKLAKQALKNTEIDIQVTLSKNEVKGKIKEFMNNKWQEEWNCDNKGRFMYNIQQKVNGNGRNVFKNRKEYTIISCIRIGHTRLNHSLFEIGKHESGKCIYCNQPETIEHVLMECEKYGKERLKLINEVKNMGVESFSMISLLNENAEQRRIYGAIIKYIKEIELI